MEILSQKIIRIPFKAILLSLVLCCGSMAAFSQERLFDVIRNNDNVGMLKASSTNTAMGLLLYIESKVKVWAVINIKVNSNQSSLYKDGILKKAAVLRTVNGSTKVNNNILWRPVGYICMKKDGDTVTHKEDIRFSIASLYFTEPVNIAKVYSETALAFVPLKKTAVHTYEVSLPDGNKNYYTYENGLCTHVKAETDHGIVYFVARK